MLFFFSHGWLVEGLRVTVLLGHQEMWDIVTVYLGSLSLLSCQARLIDQFQAGVILGI